MLAPGAAPPLPAATGALPVPTTSAAPARARAATSAAPGPLAQGATGAARAPARVPVEKAAAYGSFQSGWAAAAAADEDDPLASMWRDAAAAASLPVADGPVADGEGGAAEAGDEFVYDIYEVEVGANEEGRGAAEAVDDLWYEELDATAVQGLEDMMSARDSDSEEEIDYPDEESELESGGEYDDDDDDEPRWQRRQGGGSTDYLDLL